MKIPKLVLSSDILKIAHPGGASIVASNTGGRVFKKLGLGPPPGPLKFLQLGPLGQLISSSIYQ